MFQRYLTYLRTEKRYSERTIRAYGDDIRQFARFCTQRVRGTDEGNPAPDGMPADFDPAAVRLDDLRAWVVSLGDEGKLAARSVNRKISSVKSYFRYLRSHRVVDKDLFARLPSMRAPRRLPSFVEESRMQRIAESFREPSDDFRTERDALVILLFYSTGMRLAELTGVSTDDFSDGFRCVKIRGKGDKERIVPVVEPVAARIRHYLELRDRQNICESGNNCLILSQRGRPVSRSEVYRIVHAVLKGAGVQGKSSPHVLRHTFATHLLNHGVDIRVIQELMGHASLEATQIYAHNSIERLREVYNHAHPRAKRDKED
ncbi:tyrosine recombinase XerC [uncultured Alistipes sp.]|uniref:tyrosine recombinase XerC n=1 Tax=uncultured Alistipes sp. TaxID=538949 RepID=UPI0026335F50|nr:tyrosine recombinase XerC [uncultured Alistipes sp.]